MTVSVILLATTAFFIFGAAVVLPKIKADVHREERQKRGAAELSDNSSPLRFPARFVLFVSYFGYGIIANVLPLNLRDHLGMSAADAGFMLLIRAAATTAAFLLLARYAFWHFKRSWIVVGQIVVLLVLAIFSVTSSAAVYAVGIAIFGAVMGLVYNESVFHGISGSRSRAGRMAIHESTLNTGSVIGSITGGVIYQASSIKASFLGSAILAMCSLAIVLMLLVKPRRPAARPVHSA
jgi:predicted MFS family arabinose efflux permease